MKKTLIRLFARLGINTNRLGYYYLIDAIIAVAETDNPKITLFGGIYRQMSDKYHTSEWAIDAAIRHVTDIAYIENTDTYRRLFGNWAYDKITSKQFILTVAVWLNNLKRSRSYDY